MAETKPRAGGTVLSGPGGKLYFVRDEVLPALALEGEALRRTKAEVGKGGGLSSSSYLKEDLLNLKSSGMNVKHGKLSKAAVKSTRSSTIMCPWFC